MDEAEKDAFQQMFSKLRKSMEPNSVAAELLSEKMLTFEQHSTIVAKEDQTDRNELILQYLRQHSGEGVFPTFVSCIRNADPAMDYLADGLESEFERRPSLCLYSRSLLARSNLTCMVLHENHSV